MQVPFAAALLLEHGVQSPSVEGDFLSHRSLQRSVEVFYPRFIAREHTCSPSLWKYWLLVLFISTELKLQRQQDLSALFLSNCPAHVLMYCFPLTAWGVVNARLGCFKGAVESNSFSNNFLPGGQGCFPGGVGLDPLSWRMALNPHLTAASTSSPQWTSCSWHIRWQKEKEARLLLKKPGNALWDAWETQHSLGLQVRSGYFGKTVLPAVVTSHLPMADRVGRLTGTRSSRVGEALWKVQNQINAWRVETEAALRWKSWEEALQGSRAPVF